VLQCSDGLSNKVSNIIRSLMDNIMLLLIRILRVLLSQYFLLMYMWFYFCLIM
jgi:cellulose synthase/poly-beta-1,6-N-acetylglucosamine synthase-like glycosyltransferase